MRLTPSVVVVSLGVAAGFVVAVPKTPAATTTKCSPEVVVWQSYSNSWLDTTRKKATLPATAKYVSEPQQPTRVTLKASTLVTKVETYHWNGGKGAVSVNVSFVTDAGTTLGPYAAAGSRDQFGNRGVYWTATPNVVLAAGTYTLIDSDRLTWSANARSKLAGIARVSGCAAVTAATAPTVVTALDPAGALRAVLPGTWKWFVNGDVTFAADGTLRQPAASLTGTWRIDGTTLVITWSHGYTDKLQLVGTKRLEGFGGRDPNATSGNTVWGEKLA